MLIRLMVVLNGRVARHDFRALASLS